jgi:prepilin-type N-terminal cleavage/methylation domain-containing protein
MKRGFSLFEILLALLIMSMIVVGGIEYASRKNETSAAEQLGHRLYLYGLAVSDYARQNPKKLAEETEFYGVNWLKNEPNPENCTTPGDLSTCKPFLGQDFNLKFQAIALEVFPDSTDPEDAQIYTRLSPLAPPSTSLQVNLVQLGRVLKYTKATNQYAVDTSLSTRAINHANNFNDPLLGSPQLTYKLSSFDTEGYILSEGYSAGTGIDTAFLRLDGSNSMKASIRFDSLAATKNIEGLNEINFDTQGAGSIKNVGSINFVAANTKMINLRLVFPTQEDNELKDYSGRILTQNDSYCAISHFKVKTQAAGNRQKCLVNLNTDGEWEIIRQGQGTGSDKPECSASCLIWGF